MSPRVAVLAAADEPAPELARSLGLPLVPPTPDASQDVDLLLRWRGGVLELAPPTARRGVAVDFEAAQWRRRAQGADLAARAVAGRSREPLDVIDATAGLGRDAFAFACRGHRVRLLEASPVVCALLADGLRRGQCSEDEPVAAALRRMTLQPGEACRLLRDGPAADVVYLDPMFTRAAGDTALPDKAMQWLHLLLQDADGDERQLLEAARAAARKRVVVKRGRKAPSLARQAPAYSLDGRSVRFDVYPS